MDSPSPPQQPDPYATAAAQGKANVEAARTTTQLNRADQYTPYGSLTWTQDAPTRTFNQQRYDEAVKAAQAQGGGGMKLTESGWVPDTSGAGVPDRNADQFYDMTPSDHYSSHITLDPRIQNLLDAQLGTSQGLQGSINNALGQVNDTFSHPAPTADAATRQRVEDALYQRSTSRLDPEYQQSEARLRSDLMNRGIVEGSEAERNAIDSFMRGKNDAYATARESAIAGGGNEMSRQFELETAARNNVLNALASLRTGAQAQTPSFGQTPSGANVNPAPVAQSIYNNYQGQLGQYNADVASGNATMGAIGSLGAAAMMAPTGTFSSLIPLLAAGSDRRLKRNITRLGTHKLGIGWYSYQYNWSETWHEGVMADEVKTVKPSAVLTFPDGLMAVNYGAL